MTRPEHVDAIVLGDHVVDDPRGVHVRDVEGQGLDLPWVRGNQLVQGMRAVAGRRFDGPSETAVSRVSVQ